MNLLLRFLTSKFSGWISILALVALAGLGSFVTKVVYDYKELQRQAAFCQGQRESLEVAKQYQEHIISQMEAQTREVKDEIEALRDQPGCGSSDVDDIVLDSLRAPD